MKKKYIVAILLGLMTCMLTGCSTDSIPSFHAMLFGEEEYVSLGYDPSDYVTLGKYKNIEVEKSVSDGDVQSALDSMIAAGDEKEVKKILREFDSIIANVNETINFKDYKVINVESFNELVDIHDNVGNPILFKERFKNVEADFIIIDNDILYKFVLKNNYVDESKYDFEEDVI